MGNSEASMRRQRANASASARPPIVASSSARKVVRTVTHKAEESTPQSATSVVATRLGAGRM